jgi:hypothetical protein
MKNLIFIYFFMLLLAGVAVAGDVPKVEVFGGYSIQRLGMPDIYSEILPVYGISDFGFPAIAESTKFQKYGFNTSFTYNANPILGIEAAFKFNSGNILNVKMQYPIYITDPYLDYPYPNYPYFVSASAKYQDFAFLVGPRFACRKNKTVTPFAHALMGFDQAKVTYNESYFSELINNDDTGFAAVVGGGIDLNVNKYFALRLIQADYFLTKHNDYFTGQNNETWNNLSLSFGAVFRFSGKK